MNRRARLRELYLAGMTSRAAAREAGIGIDTARAYLREEGVLRPHGGYPRVSGRTIATVRHLVLERGMSNAEAAAATGVAVGTAQELTSGKRARRTVESHREILRLHGLGYTPTEIADVTGASRVKVYNVINLTRIPREGLIERAGVGMEMTGTDQLSYLYTECGMTCLEIQIVTGVERSMVWRTLKAAGVQMRPMGPQGPRRGNPMLPERREAIRKMRAEGATYQEIAKRMKCSRATAARVAGDI